MLDGVDNQLVLLGVKRRPISRLQVIRDILHTMTAVLPGCLKWLSHLQKVKGQCYIVVQPEPIYGYGVREFMLIPTWSKLSSALR